jgi:hypothetical protein
MDKWYESDSKRIAWLIVFGTAASVATVLFVAALRVLA